MTTTAPRTRPAPPALLKAASVTAVLTALGSFLGFTRDMLLARIFGANTATDAFLVAWMVPETAAPLLIEGALAFLLVPLFSRAVERGDDLRRVAAETLPPIGAVLLAGTALTALGAPWVVAALAPGIAEYDLAVACTRVTSVTILTFGLAGYLSAALRANQSFTAPAGIYVAYNLGIVGFVVGYGDRLGVLAAAFGVMAGSVAMVLVQTPGYVRHVGFPRRPAPGALLCLGAFVPIAVYTLLRQGQVFVERFLGSSLAAGAISHMNYAQKIAQLPMVLSLIVATVTFPQLVRSITAGDTEAARARLTGDVAAAAAIVLAGAAVLAAFAPDIVRLLLQHGAFTEADTAATAHVMRVYSAGLLGHAVVGVVCRAYFCAPRPPWYPAAAMVAGLTLTAVLATVTVRHWDVGGIAAANAAGITLAAGILLAGLRGGVVALPARAVARVLCPLALAAAVAAGTGLLVRPLLAGLPAAPALGLGVTVVALVFGAVALVSGPKEVTSMITMRRTGERA